MRGEGCLKGMKWFPHNQHALCLRGKGKERAERVSDVMGENMGLGEGGGRASVFFSLTSNTPLPPFKTFKPIFSFKK